MQFEFNVEVKHFYAVNDMELIYRPYSNNCFETIACIYKSDTAVAEQCQNQCIALIALTNLSDKIKLVNGLIFQLNMTD